jgi:CshA-type fibril repeat protein
MIATSMEIPPASASAAMTLAVDYTPDSSDVATEVAPGSKVDLTATAPVSVAGTTNQMVQIELEPGLVLTGASDVRAPAGWLISYSIDGTTWTTVAPTTTPGWAAIRFVKADGPLVSEGTDSSGRQIASTDANAAQPTSGQFPTTTGSSGDGWDVFFDNQGRLFNVWHHNGGGSNQSVDCYLRTGVRCHGTWPYLLLSGSAPAFTMHTNEQSSGVYDPIAQEIWFPTVYSSGGVNQVGFACLRTDDITLTNKWCGGSAATAFVSAGVEGNLAGSTCISGGTSTYLYDCTGGIAKSGNRIYSWHTARGDLMCVDISANNGAGAPCSSGGLTDFGSSLTDVSSTGNRWRPIVMEWNGRIYGNGGRYLRAVCIVASTGLPCAGWTNARTINARSTRIFKLPTPQGGVAGVCFSSLDTARTCFDENGTDITSSLTSNFVARFTGTYRSTYDAYGSILYNHNTRLYWGDSNWAAGQGRIYCWDFGTDNWCRNWTSSGIADTNYQIVLDPYNPNCLWSNSHDGVIQTYDTFSGAMGNCAVPAPTAVFDAGANLPRMACANANAIQEWRSFTLTADFAYTSATLTVKKGDGSAITGWTNVSIPSSAPKTVDLSALSVAASGQSPTFTVTFTGRTEYGEVSARTTAIGGSPELCLRPTAIACPTGPVFVLSELAAGTTQVEATGTATAGATVTPFSPASATVNIGAKSASACSSSLSGTALTTAGGPVSGAVVKLTDTAGTPLVYPADYGTVALRGQAITAITDSSGQYSFPNVVPGTYAVQFNDVPTAAVTGTSVVGGTTTSENTTAITLLTSAPRTLVAGAAGVINATYTAFPTLTKKFFPSTVAKGQISTLIFTLTNSPGNAAKSNLGFVDTLPAGLVVDTNSNMMTTCSAGGANVTRDPASMTATSGVITVANASIANGVSSCEYSIAVRADTAGTYTNDASNVTTTGLTKDTLATKVVTNDSASGKFACDTNMYHIMGSQLYRMDPRDTRIISYEIGSNTLAGIDAIGFNKLDGFMYGIATSSSNGRTAGNLVKIDSSGVVTDMGAISGVTTANMTGIKGGDFDDSGNLVVHSYLNSPTIYSINVSTKVATVITASASFPAEDLAYSNGYFYSIGWDGSNKNLFTIRKSDWTVTAKAVLPDQGTNAGEGIYTNGFGELFIIRTPFASQHKLWRLSNPQTVTAASEWVLMGTGDGGVRDGAMCHDSPVPTAVPDTTLGPLNTAQSVNLLTNDVKTVSAAGVATNLDPASIRLCDPATNQVAPNCTVGPGSTITVANVGTYSVDNTGVVTFTPVNGYTGTPTPIGYQVTDTNGQVGNSTYTPTVSSTTPIAFNNTSSGPYDTNQTLNVLANDIAGTLSAFDVTTVRLCTTATTVAQCTGTILTIAGEGTYTVNPDGTVTFNPLPTFTGTATTIKYVVQDGIQQSTNATITVTVADPAPPVATSETKSVIPGGTVAFTTLTGSSGLATSTAAFDIAATCLITPASSPATCDADGIVTIAGEGTYTLNTSTGVVTFVAAANATPGTKTALTYRVTDVTGQTATSTLTPIIPPVPTATNDTSAGAYDTNQTISPLTNDAAGSGATLTASSVKLCATTSTANASCNLTTLTVPNQGTYTVNANGTITFDPLPTFKGAASPVKYVVADSTTQLASATITPTVTAPAAPVATADTEAVIPGGTATFTTITGANGLATSGVGLVAASTCLITPSTTTCDADGIVTIAGEGTYTLNTTTGVVTFVADANATQGTKTPLTYQVTDITGQTATSTLTPIIPAPPVAVNDTSSGAYDANQTISILGNDTVTSPATLIASSVKLCATTSTANASCDLTTLTVAGVGTYTVNSDGTVIFNPLASFTGTAPPVKYAVQDSTGQLTGATITPTVAMPALPVVTPETKTVIPGATATFTTITGAGALATSGVGLVAASTCLYTPNTTTCDADGVVTVAGEGTYTLNATTGIVTFVADANVTAGTKTPITYQVTDTFGQTATSTLTPIVPPAPVGTNDTSSGAYDTNQTISPLSNDTPGSGATLVPTSVKLCATTSTANASCNLTTLTVPNEGTYTVNADGTITFDPLPTFRGTASPVKYIVADTTGQVTSATITATVAAPGVPVANPESKAVIPGGTATFTTLTGANGLGSSGVGFNTSLTCLYTPSTTNCDADGVIVIAGEGTYTLNQSTGVVTFVADANATQGTKTPITYRITDITGQTATSTLTPVVPAPPVAVNDTSSGAYDTNQTISILGNDTVTSPATLVPTSVKLCATTSTLNANCNLTTLTVPNEGTYTVNANGTITFDPLPTFVGTASPIKYVVADTTGQVTGAMITPTVSMPAVPVATSESKAVIPGGTATFTTLTGANGLATSSVGFNTSVTCLVTPSTTSCDPDGVVTIAGEGTYTLNTSTGVVTFVADVNATQGTKTALSYKVTDIFGQTSTSTLTPVIPAPPIGVNDTSSGAYDTNQTISILGNDTVTSPATLVPTSVKLCATTSTLNANCNLTTLTVPNEGTYTVNANGTITFDPLPTFVGTASPIKYVVADSTGQLANATITPTVSMPAVPVATPQTKAVIPGGAIAFTTLTGANGLATSGVGFNTSVTCLITPSTTSCDPDGIVTIAGEGTYTLNTSTGVITFVADVNATQGTKTALTYKVTDVFGQTATSTITPVIPAPPVAVNDTSTGAFDTNQTISPLTNDSATTPATLVASSVKLCATTSTVNASCTLTTLTVSNEGTYTVNANGTITFDPLPTFVGTASPVKYVVADTTGQLASATITPAVSMPAAPVATPQTKIVIPGGSTAFTTVTGTGGLATTPVSFNTSATCLYTPSTASCDADGIVTIAGEGTFTLDTSTGVVTFVADINATVGTKTPLAYKVTDVFGQTATSTLTPIIPAPPAALNDTNTDAYDVTQVISPLTNDSAVAPATLVASSVKLCATTSTANASCNLLTLTVPNEGTYTVNANGTVSFDPLATFIGTASPVKYIVADINGRVGSATITPTVLMPPPPVATPDLRAVAPASTVSFQSVTGSGALAAGAVGGAALDPTTLCIVDPSTMICGTTPVTIAGEGTYSVNISTGVVSYTSLATAPIGRRASITYRVTDIFGQTVTSTLTPVIPPMPTIRDDSSAGPWNTAQTLIPVTNDLAGTGTLLNATTVKLCLDTTATASTCTGTTLTVAGEGTYTVLANGNVKFVPLSTFSGTATSIRYSVSDGAGQAAMANIIVVVAPPTNKPAAKPQTLEVNRGESVQFTTITGRQGLAVSKIGLDKTKVCLIDPTPVPVSAADTNVCDEDGIVTVKNLGTFKLNKATGVVTFTASRNAKAGRGLSVTYQVTDMAGQTVQSKLTPIIPARPQLPATGANSTEPLLLAALLMISIGVATNRSKRFVSRPA